MKCSNCGKELNDGELFCSNCGTKVEGNTNDNNQVNNDSTNQTNTNNNQVVNNNTNQNTSEKSNVYTNSNKTENTTVNTNNTQNNKNNNWIGIIITVIILAIVIAGVNSNNNTTKNEPLVNLPPLNLPEIEPVKINEDAFSPEAVNEHSYDKLQFKLPDSYKSNSSDLESNAMLFSTDWKNDECYSVSVETRDFEGGDLEQVINVLEDYEFDIEGYVIESSEDVKSEFWNGTKWFIKGLKVKSPDASSNGYVEYYYAQNGNKLYCVSFIIETQNGKSVDTSKTTQFYNIKDSLKFN